MLWSAALILNLKNHKNWVFSATQKIHNLDPKNKKCKTVDTVIVMLHSVKFKTAVLLYHITVQYTVYVHSSTNANMYISTVIVRFMYLH